MAEARKKHRKTPMSRVDTAWLRMERATNLMMITGVLMLESPLDIKTLRKVIEQKFLSYPRFRQKAVDGPTGAFWQEDADFDLDWHLHLTALPGKGGKRELERLTSQLASTPLDKSKPLWQFHLVERFGGGSALITRIHHCYADGMALVQVILSMTEMGEDSKRKAALAKRWLKKEEHAPVAQRVGAIDRYVKLGNKMLEKGMDFYRDPTLAAVLANEGVEIAREIGHALALPDDPETVLKGRLGVSKRVAWAERLPLEEVKSVSRALRCTVNCRSPTTIIIRPASACRGRRGPAPSACLPARLLCQHSPTEVAGASGGRTAVRSGHLAPLACGGSRYCGCSAAPASAGLPTRRSRPLAAAVHQAEASCPHSPHRARCAGKARNARADRSALRQCQPGRCAIRR